MANKINIKNKKAAYAYFLTDEFTAGIQLTGTEIKSIRAGKVSIAEAYCTFIKDELFIRSMHISEYTEGSYNNHDPKRDRKLLLTKKELKKIATKTVEKGLTIVPLRLYISENGFAKIEIAIGRGKKYFDKRDTIKSKDIQRDMDRGERY
ncbi:MAG: SsrA-binding protein SmpB [Saprospiraceae bacterium]|nr:SsrA-binding protein SmpB [Saprospiraceae bacterium]